MSARIAKLEALLARVAARKDAPRGGRAAAESPAYAAAQPGAVAAQEPAPEFEPLPLDSPSIIPPSMEPDSLEVPELDAPLMDRVPDSVDVTEVELDEEIPESGPVATPKGEELAPDSEQPITPPPESVEELVAPAARQHVSEPAFVARVEPQRSPTMEQLGQTVDLDEGDSKSTLELDEPGLEEATNEIVITPSVHAQIPAAAPSERYGAWSGAADAAPQLVQRAQLDATVVGITSQASPTPTSSFLELVDAALRLK